jgi:hypothetical protein
MNAGYCRCEAVKILILPSLHSFRSESIALAKYQFLFVSGALDHVIGKT